MPVGEVLSHVVVQSLGLLLLLSPLFAGHLHSLSVVTRHVKQFVSPNDRRLGTVSLFQHLVHLGTKLDVTVCNCGSI